MSYYSDIRILMGEKAFELLEKRCGGDEGTNAWELLERKEQGILLSWNNVKWNEKFSDVQEIESVLIELSEIVNEDNEKIKDYFYKIVRLEETGASTEDTNDEDEKYTSDLYITHDISM